jgi:hypothetical protein
MRHYRAVEIIRSYKDKQGIDELSPEVTDLLIRCLNNLTAAQLKVSIIINDCVRYYYLYR